MELSFEAEELAHSLKGAFDVGTTCFCFALLLMLGLSDAETIQRAVGKSFGNIDEALQSVGEKIKQDEVLLAFLDEYGLNIFNENGQIKSLEEISKQFERMGTDEYCTD